MLILLLGLVPAAAANTHVTTETLRLEFDSAGRLQSAFACFPLCVAANARVQQFGDAGVVIPDFGGGDWRLSQTRSAGQHELHFDNGAGASLTWRIPARGYRLELEVAGTADMHLNSGVSFRPREASGFGTWLEQARYLYFDGDAVRQVGFDDTDAAAFSSEQWFGYRNRYWTLVARPPGPVEVQLITAEGQEDGRLSVGEAAAGTWLVYLGPVEPSRLKEADAVLDRLMYAGLWFWLRWICFGMFYLLAGIQAVIPSWGLAVMAMSLIVNVLMLPLSRIAERLQQQVNETEARLAPELRRIKQQFKGEEQAAKILALYKTERVHPLYSLKSMAGVAVVIPVFIGAFDMLAENIHLLNTGFLWISDLSRPDALFGLPLRLPFFGAELNLLPFLMTGLSVVASGLHRPLALDADLRSRQVRNMLLLAVAFFVLFYTFPAGMVLYWTTNNLISVIKSLWARR
jgi:YidC/Oxa1 family membrane protein insertase